MKHARLRLGPYTTLPIPCFPSLRFFFSILNPSRSFSLALLWLFIFLSRQATQIALDIGDFSHPLSKIFCHLHYPSGSVLSPHPSTPFFLLRHVPSAAFSTADIFQKQLSSIVAGQSFYWCGLVMDGTYSENNKNMVKECVAPIFDHCNSREV